MHAWTSRFTFGCLALVAVACGSKDDNGTPATGGKGGSTGTAGTGTGGTGTGTAGAGTGGSGGAAPTRLYSFDADTETWKGEYVSQAPGATPLVLADVGVEWVATGGDAGGTGAGAVQCSIPYMEAGQYFGVGISLATPEDLSGKTITARVKVVSGLGDPTDLMTNPGGAKLYVKSGTVYEYAAGTFNNLTMIGSWYTIRFNLAAPDYIDPANATLFDAADIREVGIQFDTGGSTTTARPAVILVDNVSW